MTGLKPSTLLKSELFWGRIPYVFWNTYFKEQFSVAASVGHENVLQTSWQIWFMRSAGYLVYLL